MGRAHEVRKVAMAKTAAAKAKLYSRYGKEIYLAAKAGGTDPDGNLALRRIIAKAKKAELSLSKEIHDAIWVPKKQALALVYPAGNITHMLLEKYLRQGDSKRVGDKDAD